MTQELCSAMGVVMQERQCTNSVTSKSMETDSPGKHSHAGHDCANCQSLDTKNALKCHPWELWAKWHIQRCLLVCPSVQMQPLILPGTPQSDLKKVGGRSPLLPFVAGERKSPCQKPLKSPGFVSPSQHRTHSNKQFHPLWSKRCAGFATLSTDTGVWRRMVQEMPLIAPLPFSLSLAF